MSCLRLPVVCARAAAALLEPAGPNLPSTFVLLHTETLTLALPHLHSRLPYHHHRALSLSLSLSSLFPTDIQFNSSAAGIQFRYASTHFRRNDIPPHRALRSVSTSTTRRPENSIDHCPLMTQQHASRYSFRTFSGSIISIIPESQAHIAAAVRF